MKRLPLLSLMLLTGCAGMLNVSTRESVLAKTQVEQDSFKKTAWLKGPEMKASLISEGMKKDKSEWQVHSYLLRAMKDEKSGQGFIQLYVSHQDTDWLYLDHAVDSDGTKMTFVGIDRQTSQHTQYGVGVIEDFAITLDEEYLQKKAAAGLLIRAYGKSGNRTIAVPPFYVQGFLDSYATFVKK